MKQAESQCKRCTKVESPLVPVLSTSGSIPNQREGVYLLVSLREDRELIESSAFRSS